MKVKKTAILLMVLLMVWAVLPPQGTAEQPACSSIRNSFG